MIDRTISEARRVATEFGLAGHDDKQHVQFAEPPRADCSRASRRICTGARSRPTSRWFLKRLERGARRQPAAGSAQHGHGRLGAQPRLHVRDHGTYGLVSRHGVFALTTSLDHVGPMT